MNDMSFKLILLLIVLIGLGAFFYNSFYSSEQKENVIVGSENTFVRILDINEYAATIELYESLKGERAVEQAYNDGLCASLDKCSHFIQFYDRKIEIEPITLQLSKNFMLLDSLNEEREISSMYSVNDKWFVIDSNGLGSVSLFKMVRNSDDEIERFEAEYRP